MTDEQKSECLEEWRNRLDDLVNAVAGWAKELGWATRRLEKTIKDSLLGTYKAPALRIQKDFGQVLLEPIARFTPGSQGVVDLYLMPAYDDVASIYYTNGEWRLHYLFDRAVSAATLRQTQSIPFNKESLNQVVTGMAEYAAQNG
jgi:hypothetical protein